MDRFNDSDIGYMDHEWVKFDILKSTKNETNRNKERSVHETLDGGTKE